MDVSSSSDAAKNEEGYQQVVEDKESQLHPVEEANIFQRWFFTWMTPLITIGSEIPLEDEDFPLLPKEVRMKNLCDQISRTWKREVQGKQNPKFGNALWNTYWPKFLESALWNIPVESYVCYPKSQSKCEQTFILLHSIHLILHSTLRSSWCNHF